MIYTIQRCTYNSKMHSTIQRCPIQFKDAQYNSKMHNTIQRSTHSFQRRTYNSKMHHNILHPYPKHFYFSAVCTLVMPSCPLCCPSTEAFVRKHPVG